MPETNMTNSFLYKADQAQVQESLGPFFEWAPYPIWIFDLETLAMVAVNQAVIDHYGYSREEMLAMKVTDLMAPFEVTRLLASLDALRRHEPPPNTDNLWIHCKKDKTILDTDTVLHEIILGGRKCIAAFIHDITERRKAREERMALLEAVLEQMPAAVLLAEAPSGRIMLVNDKVEALLGRYNDPSQSVEKYIYTKAKHLDGQPYTLDEYPLTRAVRNGEVIADEEMLYRRDDGSCCTVSVSAAPVRNLDEKIIAAVVTIFDLTERKRVQEERERLLREWAEAEQQATQRMDTFLAIASHELKTPLTAVIGILDVLTILLEQQRDQASGLSPSAFTIKRDPLSLLNRAQQQTELLVRLINDLVDVSRIQSDKLELRMQSCDLVSIVREKVEEQRDASPRRTLHFSTLGVDSAMIYADPERIGQVVTNYLSNALKYSRAEQPVDVWLQRDDQHVSVHVRDRGAGIPQEAREKIWERFYRIPGTQVKSEAGIGLGLGLHICRTIIERHGGHVGVESKPAEGSTFWFTLPLAL